MPSIKSSIKVTEKWSLLFSVLLICCGPFWGSWCVVASFVILLYRILAYDINSSIIDIVTIISYSAIYKLSPNGVSLVLYYILIADVFFILKGKLKNTGLIILLIYCFVYLFLRSDFVYNQYLTIIASLILLAILISNVSPYALKTILFYYCLGLSISICYGWIFKESYILSLYLNESIQVAKDIDVIRFKGLFADPNYLGTFCTLGLALILQRYLTNLPIKRYLLFVVIICLASILTLSKSVTLQVIFLLAILFIYSWRNKSTTISIAITLCLLLFTYYAMTNQISVVSIVFDRFKDGGSMNDITTGRSDLWQVYMSDIFSSLSTFMWGHGFSAGLLDKGTHNIFLEIMYFTGFWGLFSVFSVFYCLFKLMSQRYFIKVSLIKFLPIIVLFLSYSALQGFFSFAFYIQIFIAFAFCLTDQRYA